MKVRVSPNRAMKLLLLLKTYLIRTRNLPLTAKKISDELANLISAIMVEHSGSVSSLIVSRLSRSYAGDV